MMEVDSEMVMDAPNNAQLRMVFTVLNIIILLIADIIDMILFSICKKYLKYPWRIRLFSISLSIPNSSWKNSYKTQIIFSCIQTDH